MQFSRRFSPDYGITESSSTGNITSNRTGKQNCFFSVHFLVSCSVWGSLKDPDSKILVRSNPDSKIATPSLSIASLVGPGMRHRFLMLEAGENYPKSKDFNYRDAWILSQIMMTSGLRGASGSVFWFSVGQVIVKR